MIDATPPDLTQAMELGESQSLADLMQRAREKRDAIYPAAITYSPKVFIPLTRLCRDVCHYCTFATTPSDLPAAYLPLEQVLDIAPPGKGSGVVAKR